MDKFGQLSITAQDKYYQRTLEFAKNKIILAGIITSTM
jgi:hypothetical protein